MKDAISFQNVRVPLRVALWFVPLALAAMFLAVSAASADVPGPIPATVERVVDGDTVEVTANIWLNQSIRTLVRVNGIDTPELRGRCPEERARAEAARDMALDLMPQGGQIMLHDVRQDKWGGRVLASVRAANGRDVAEALIAGNLAIAYDGRGARRDWCR